jgi:hypothetical protein
LHAVRYAVDQVDRIDVRANIVQQANYVLCQIIKF